MAILSLNKVVGVLLLGIIAVCLYAMMHSPLTPPGKKTLCRHELSAIRGALLSGEVANGGPFSGRRNLNSNNVMSVRSQMAKCCLQYSQWAGRNIFNFKRIGGEECVVDPWGSAYNIATIADLDSAVNTNRIGKVSVDGLIVWSSGPNGINENGAGDDVFLLRKE